MKVSIFCVLLSVALIPLQVLSQAPCIANGPYNTTDKRKKIKLHNSTHLVQLGIYLGNWAPYKINAEIFKIVVTEVMGYDADFYPTAGSKELLEPLYALAGCEVLKGGNFSCAQESSVHVALEWWLTDRFLSENNPSEAKKVKDFVAAYPDRQPEQVGVEKSAGYSYYRHLWMKTADVQDALVNDSIILDDYFSWNASGQKFRKYFEKNLSDISPIMPCSGSPLGNADAKALGAAYHLATGDSGGVNMTAGDKRPNCTDGWWRAPECRALGGNVSQCIPLFVDNNRWYIQEIMQKAFFHGLPVAIAVTDQGNPLTDKAPVVSKKALQTFWEPSFFGGHGGNTYTRINFPPHNGKEWSKKLYGSSPKDYPMTMYANRHLKKLNRRVYDFLVNYKLTNGDLANLLNSGISAGAERAAACNWVKANEATYKSWIPDPIACYAGEGLVDAKGDWVMSRAGAVSCKTCSEGMFSRVLADGISNASTTYVCDKCEIGTSQPGTGQIYCQMCQAGTIAAVAGSRDCSLCPLGRYQTKPGQGTCDNCTAPWTTLDVGAASATKCVCPAGTYRACRNPLTAGNLRPGCDCNPSMYVAENENLCLPCPEGLTCKGGADEMFYPCSATDKSKTGEYPMPKYGYYAEFSAPTSVYECLNKGLCPGSALQACREYASGIACGKCDDGYYKFGGQCKKCEAQELNTLWIILAPILVFACYKSYNPPVEGWVSHGHSVPSMVAMLFIFWQTMSALLSSFPFLGPRLSAWESWTEYITDLDMLQLRRLDCSYGQFENSYIIIIVGPWVIGAIFALIWGICYPIKTIRMDLGSIMGTYGALLKNFAITIAMESFRLFQTYEHPNGKQSMRTNENILKGSSEYDGAMGIGVIAILINCIAFPCVCFVICALAPKKFCEENFRSNFKWLFVNMRPTAHWWVMVVILKGVWIGLTTVMFSTPNSYLIWNSTGLVIYLSGAFALQPWRDIVVTYVDVYCHICLAMMCAILPFFMQLTSDQLNEVAVLYTTFTFIGFAIAIVACGIILARSKQNKAHYEVQAKRACSVLAACTDTVAITQMLETIPSIDRLSLQRAVQLVQSEMFGQYQAGRVNWRREGRMPRNKQDGSRCYTTELVNM
eukprot:TRINITY_DN48542_c0_g1_i1.p1 TRINITY_DN48542_c0_g1~~TRINITY_DN48542_c0_g1_i1.p1  ORF type:complete len:1117 (+),score=143.11 TRINITY_DN48542_c0_g1_i1:72-3422(+)